MVCRWTQLSFPSHSTIIWHFVASGASLKSWRKYHFPLEKATWRVRVRAHFSWFSIPFFILNYPFDTNFGNPAVESSRTIYQCFLVFFYFSFFYGYSRDRPHSIFFYVTLGQKRSNVKVAREINIPHGGIMRDRGSRIKVDGPDEISEEMAKLFSYRETPYDYVRIYKRQFNTFILKCIFLIWNTNTKP